MGEHRYILEKYKGMQTRYVCPACKITNKTFTLYIDTETGEHLGSTVGKCNRESKCSYHYTPKQYFEDNKHLIGTKNEFSNSLKKSFNTNTRARETTLTNTNEPQQKPTSFISVELFKASLKNLETNHFVKFLIETFGAEVAKQLIGRYFIASSKLWDGATVFWQIDGNGKVRTGKIMLYDAITGKRVKKPYSLINWVHKVIKGPDYELKQCLFGEHLLIDKAKPIAIVESEKTAIIASVYLPQFIWLAVGSLTNLTTDKCSGLKGRSVTLFPDLNGFKKWSDKAKELSHITTFTVSDLLERKATEAEREQGLDLADYLIRLDYKDFITVKTPNENLTKPDIKERDPIITDNYGMPKEDFLEGITHVKAKEDWSNRITDIENYFETHPPPKAIRLNSSGTITDMPTFITSHLKTVKANNGKRTFLPYLERLEHLKEITSIV